MIFSLDAYYGNLREFRSCRRPPYCLAIMTTLLNTAAIAHAEPAADTTSAFIRLDNRGEVWTNSGTEAFWPCAMDRRTGLIWETKTRDGGLHDVAHTYSRQPPATPSEAVHCAETACDAPSYVAALNAAKLCGRSHWRLPTREELRSLVNYQRRYPGPTIDTAVFPHTANNFYWSASRDASDAGSAWGIGFAYGFDYAYPTASAGYLRLVHDTASTPQTQTRFEIRDPTMVFDASTGLLWQRCSVGQQMGARGCTGAAAAMTFESARAYADATRVWRLPTLPELAGLVNLTRITPASFVEVFPNTPPDSYWSATPFANDSSQTWLVNFMYGDSYVDAADRVAAVRLVRRDDRPPR